MADRTDPIYGEAERPRFAAERIADALMEHSTALADAEGVGVRRMFLLVELDRGPGDEPRLATCGLGYEDGRDMLASLYIHFAETARQLGLTVRLLAPDKPMGNG